MLRTHSLGRIASDINVKQSKDKKSLYTSFIIASHDRGNTTYIRCTAFNGLAKLLGEFFSKGDRISLEGDLVEDKYKDKDTYKIIVRDFEFVETKEEHNKNVEKHKDDYKNKAKKANQQSQQSNSNSNNINNANNIKVNNNSTEGGNQDDQRNSESPWKLG